MPRSSNACTKKPGSDETDWPHTRKRARAHAAAHEDGSHGTVNGDAAIKFRGAERDGVPGTRRIPCLRTPEQTKPRQVACFQGKREGYESHTDRLQATIDTTLGRQLSARRVATVAPVFGNLRHHTRLDRFTRWSRAKVDGPWQLSCLTHTIEKLTSYGSGR